MTRYLSLPLFPFVRGKVLPATFFTTLSVVALFSSLSSDILSTCPAHSSLLLVSLSVVSSSSALPSLPLTPPFFSCLPSSLLLFFVPSCFHTLAAFVVVVRPLPRFPFRTVTPVVTQVPMTLPFCILEIRRSITSSTACSPRVRSGLCSSTYPYLSLRLSVSAHCPS